ncbi:ABC-2 type transport system ATP-binding protein [Symbiobacterium terraclitae]|uniref:ABC-2 type transport system ATP-binding protein n=1 Tax=Symbiobacterium terraclitae TaxID=557451 RepID=A0ABS4JRF2_9FIRM|nr:ABC transporter ATP-binding protein [Symbiobacterium terraclitae]MBP2017476.1 ABC-2 type transport system ATP-binding protein [Symbiobacterium terraclitae]
MDQILIDAQGLTKRYGDVVAVHGFSLQVRAGEIVGLLGPNGAGKTTAIEMMEGLRVPDAGQCRVCGFDSLRQSREIRHRIGIALQWARLPEYATVLEVLTLYASFYEDPLPVGDLLRRFSLEEKARTQCNHLSGGQRQRLALAVALIGRPAVLFLDEPTTGLDPQARHALWDVILGLREEGRAILLTTHYMDEAERLCDRVVVMDHGRILAEGSPRQLARAYGPEAAVELDPGGAPVDLAALARLPAVTGVRSEDGRVLLHTANPPATLMALANYAQEHSLPLSDLRTRSATMEDVFMALTGRRLRD